MKKKHIILCVAIVFILFSSIGIAAQQFLLKEKADYFSEARESKTGNTIVATVNNEKIYQHQVNIIRAAQKLSQKNAEKYGVDSLEKTIQSDEEILKSLIRNVVIVQEAKKQNLTANYSEAKKYIQSNYESIISKNDENSEFLREYMKELDLSKSEYIDLASEEYQDVMTREKFYNNFVSKNSDKQENIDNLYNEYIEELIESADITFKLNH